MIIKWTHISGFGPSAWQHDDNLPRMPFMIDQHKKDTELVLHHHETRLHAKHRFHDRNPHIRREP